MADEASPTSAEHPGGDEPGSEGAPASSVNAGADAGAGQFSVEGLMDALRQAKVSELLLSTVSTLATVAYGKLEARDLGEAKAAIDAIGTILPLLSGELDPGLVREVDQALANLRLAYADAVSEAQ